MTAVAPCKRPKVELVPAIANPSTFVAVCHVPGCGWTYPRDPQRSVAQKSDAQQQATWHRQAHRAGVPRTWIECDLEYNVYCEPCGGHRRTFATRAHAKHGLNYHLVAEHGLVVCS